MMYLVIFLLGVGITLFAHAFEDWYKARRADRLKTEVHAGVKVYESAGPPPPPRSPGFASQPRQSRLKSPRGQPRE